MSKRLTLGQRDDPLAPSPRRAARPGAAANAPAAPAVRASTEQRDGGEAKRKPGPTVVPEPAPGVYDDDRLEQAGWRVYESVKARVRADAEALSAAGTPTSEASYAAAVLALRAPATVEQGQELMREWNQLTASRRRRRG